MTTVAMRPTRGRLVWGADHYRDVIGAMRRATTSVWVATANVKDVQVEWGRRRYGSLLQEFARLAAAGVELRVLHATLPSRPFRDTFDGLPRLVAGGLALRLCPRVHMKTVIVDGRWLYLGSANLTGAGLGVKGEHRRNFELGWFTDDESAIDEIQAEFDRIWSGRACAGCGLRSSCDAPLDLRSPASRKRSGARNGARAGLAKSRRGAQRPVVHTGAADREKDE